MAPDPTNRPEPRESGAVIHRREMRRQAYAPMFLTGLVIFIVFIIAATLPGRVQVSTLADWMTTILIYCPMTLCLGMMFVFIMMLVWGMNALHRMVGTPLQKLENATESLANRVENSTQNVNKRVINWRTRIATLEKLMTLFDGEPDDESRKS